MSGGARGVAAIILAAGASRRMGTAEAAVAARRPAALQHALDAAAGAAVDEIVIVLGTRGRGRSSAP